jgi:hypothetical protein
VGTWLGELVHPLGSGKTATVGVVLVLFLEKPDTRGATGQLRRGSPTSSGLPLYGNNPGTNGGQNPNARRGPHTRTRASDTLPSTVQRHHPQLSIAGARTVASLAGAGLDITMGIRTVFIRNPGEFTFSTFRVISR